MIFIYNETEKEFQLSSKELKGDTVGVFVQSKDKPEENALITKSVDTAIIRSIKKRYNEPVDITSPIHKEYISIKDTRILLNTDFNTMDNLGNVNDTQESSRLPKITYVKNMVVLILNQDSKFFVKQKNITRSAYVRQLGSVKIVCMYFRTSNWSIIKEPLTILIKSAIDKSLNVLLDLTAEDVEGKSGKKYKRNKIDIKQYDGTFPTPREHSVSTNNNEGRYQKKYGTSQYNKTNNTSSNDRRHYKYIGGDNTKNNSRVGSDNRRNFSTGPRHNDGRSSYHRPTQR